mmetsp:Transcript_887/g.2514  ORF Transcript_887/g.2514 Transcript_887/m.2514 type:complete len:257 (-) Transcript_887:336-1106(-)
MLRDQGAVCPTESKRVTVPSVHLRASSWHEFTHVHLFATLFHPEDVEQRSCSVPPSRMDRPRIFCSCGLKRTIEIVNGFHIFVGELKVETVQVRDLSFRILRCRDDCNLVSYRPVQNDLRHFAVVCLGDAQQRGIRQNRILFVTAKVYPLRTQCAVCLVLYAFLLASLPDVLVLLERVHPILNDVGFHSLRQQLIKNSIIDITNPDGARLAFIVDIFQGPPAVLPGSFWHSVTCTFPTACLVQQHRIHIVSVEALQ